TTPQSVAGAFSWKDIAAGLKHTCGLTTNDEIYCWGDNTEGQLGTGDNTSLTTPTTAVSGTQTWVDVSVGADHSCGTTSNGEVYCWGSNSSGQIGLDPATTTSRNTPVEITISGETLHTVELGFGYSCTIANSSDAYCWGFNGQANFGNGAPSAVQYTPVKIGGGYSWSQLGAGLQHTCGINQFIDAYCMGDNDNGELGLGTTTEAEFTPKAVTRPTL
ncbi:MAG: RCC1 domain-containing protein, partial [Myxococcota bacterium]